MNGIIDEAPDGLLVAFESFLFITLACADFETISFVDFERLRWISCPPSAAVATEWGGDVEYVRCSFCSALLERRKLAWNDDDRVKLIFDVVCRSSRFKTTMRDEHEQERTFYPRS